jgi:hypothetical protein
MILCVQGTSLTYITNFELRKVATELSTHTLNTSHTVIEWFREMCFVLQHPIGYRRTECWEGNFPPNDKKAQSLWLMIYSE